MPKNPDYVPGSRPDPDFVAFYEYWLKLVERTNVPGHENPSWDRRAAYMLYIYGKDKPDFRGFTAWLQNQPMYIQDK